MMRSSIFWYINIGESFINPIHDFAAQKVLPTNFSPVTPTKVTIVPQIFLNFSFNRFDRLVLNL